MFRRLLRVGFGLERKIPASMEVRHNELVMEMLSRGMNHQSP